MRSYKGENNPHFGKKGRNQYSNRDWQNADWDLISWNKKREILMQNANYMCSVCGFCEIRPDGFSILQIDHIDGNNKNDVKSNLRVVCPNCHALTSKSHLFFGRKHTSETKEKIRQFNLGLMA